VSVIVEIIRQGLEIASCIAVIVAARIASVELKSHFKEASEAETQRRLDVARAVYREVDGKYNSFLTLSLEHPRLDCFSTAKDCLQGVPLTETEKQQQRLLYTLLVDVCEVAHVEYHRHLESKGDDRVAKFFRSQWPGWESYIRKFMTRQAFRDVWKELKDEYDESFSRFMTSVSDECEKSASGR
jgi:hypothetical protein